MLSPSKKIVIGNGLSRNKWTQYTTPNSIFYWHFGYQEVVTIQSETVRSVGTPNVKVYEHIACGIYVEMKCLNWDKKKKSCLCVLLNLQSSEGKIVIRTRISAIP